MNKKYKIVYERSKNGEHFVKFVHRNGSEVFKETYKRRSTLMRIMNNLIVALKSGDYETVVED